MAQSLLYASSVGANNLSVATPIIQKVNPTSQNWNCPIGIRWINEITGAVFVLIKVVYENNIPSAVWQIEIGSVSPLTEFLLTEGTSPVVTSNNSINFYGDGLRINSIGSPNTITLSLIDPLPVNILNMAYLGGLIAISDKSSTTASIGKAQTVTGMVTVTTSALTDTSIIIVSPRGLVVNNNDGTFSIYTSIGGPYPPTEVLYSYWIIN